jgi:peptidoglycan/LPS O-acetylase OafA/YrhL
MSLRNLDVLRGLLALYVVITHARWLLWEGHAAFMAEPHPFWAKALAYGSGVFKYGHLAVMVFFALSGFFIHLRMAQRFAAGETKPQFCAKEYLLRRAWRVLPPYYFALALTFVLDAIGRHYYPTLYAAATPDTFTNELFALKGYRVESVLPALLLLPRSLGFYYGSNGPLWSLGFEIVYYLAYPAWFALRRKLGTRAYFIAFGLALVGASLRGHVGPALLDWFVEVLSLWAVWLAGAWLAEMAMVRSMDRRVIPSATLAAVLAWLGQQASLPKPVELPLLMTLGVAVTLIFVALPGRVLSRPFTRWIEIFGQRSYTLYICHFPVIALISARCFETSARPAHGWLAIYGVAAALLVSNVCFHLCEVHFIHPRIRIEPKPAPMPVAAQLALVKTAPPNSGKT